MRWIDIPPVWLAGALVLAWWTAVAKPLGLSFGGAWADLLGGLCVGGGVLLMALAVIEMRRHRTTVIPHRQADVLVTSGIFARSRNPIYVGDALILTGFVLAWDAPLALVLVPPFVWIIERRFVLPEERRLQARFGAEFDRYRHATRRWL